MSSVEFVGWASSVVLLATIAAQIRKQWRERTSRGVSKWLFIGQVSAEAGFVAYSLLLDNWVFAATNAVLLFENLVGLGVTIWIRQAESAPGATENGRT